MKSKGEVFHSCEHWLKLMTDLRYTSGLPAEGLALHAHHKGRMMPAYAFVEVREHDQGDKLFVEMHVHGAEAEFASPADELEHATEIECELVEEFNVERHEERCVDSGQESLQIGAAAPEDKYFEAGKHYRCRSCRILESPLGNWPIKLDNQGFKMGHAKEVCNQVRRVELRGGWGVRKLERDEALSLSE